MKMAVDKISYIRVSEEVDDEPIEIPCEEDSTILLSTLASTFPGVSGLKYKNDKTGTMRALRLTDGRLNAPDEGWASNEVYYCSFPKENKRKMEESGENESNIKNKRVDSDDPEKSNDTDLIILGLAWKTTEKELTEYFTQYGELEMAEVKIDPRTGRSKGFGFVRFKDLTKHSELVGSRHQIDGRWCDVKLPVPRGEDEEGFPRQTRGRIFIGRLTRHIEEQDLKEYFSKFGDITDCYIPKPFRGFGFVTFEDAKNANQASKGETTIKGVQLYVSYAMPKAEGAAFHGGYGGAAAPPPRGAPGGWERSAPYGGGYDRGYERGPPPYGGYGGYERAPPRGGYGGGYGASGGYNSPNHYGGGPNAAGNGGPASGTSPNGAPGMASTGNGSGYGSKADGSYAPQAPYQDYGYGRGPPPAAGGPGGRTDPPTYHPPGQDSAYPRAAPYASYREYSGYPGTGYRQ